MTSCFEINESRDSCGGCKDLIEIPFGFNGKIFRSPMPFSPYDETRQVWSLYRQMNVQFVLVLAEKNEILDYSKQDLLGFYESQGVSVEHFPIPDYQVPRNLDAFRVMIENVKSRAETGINLAVHCLAGIGRTGLVLAVMAKEYLKMDSDEAIWWVRTRVPGAVETEQQVQFIRDYSRSMHDLL
jgi:protein-tyrosine phosphatase